MPTFDSLQFDLSDCVLREESASHRMYSRKDHVAHLVRIGDGPPKWPFDLTRLNDATEFYRAQCAENRGVMLSLDLTTVSGVEALRGLFKYRAPIADSLALYFVEILWLPFSSWNAQINVEAMETGITGGREAAVSLLEHPKSQVTTDAEPIRVTTMEEMFARMAQAPLRALSADDRKYDVTFPTHPLSQVRARMDELVKTLRVDVDKALLKPFRRKPRWQFW